MIELPVIQNHATHCGPVKKSKRGIYRAGVLIAVHLVVLVHIAHWRLAGKTLTPVEPSESMQTLELGYVNAGFILFVALILSTLVLGRFFCGWACHVVAYQDLCAWLLNRVGLRPRPVRSRLLVFVPLGAAVYMFAWPQVARLLEGRLHPGFVAWHLTTSTFWRTFPGPVVGMLTFLVDGFLLVWLLGAKGFCTYGCPYGAVFGLADRVAPGRILVTDACMGCGHCTATCTSNVRVHEEVRLYGAVVDSGCMKCLDCVNVCPKDALYFGFGAPSLAIRKRKRPRRIWDFSWKEEIGMTAAFLGALYAFRGLYGRVPMMLALGLSVLFAIAVAMGVRLLRRGEVGLQYHRLRLGGRPTRAGLAAAALIIAFFAFTVHSGIVQYHTREGERLLTLTRSLSGAWRVVARDDSLRYLLAAERFGLFGNGVLQFQVAAIFYDRGDLSGAERHLRSAVAIDPGFLEAWVRLSGLLLDRGDQEAAARALARAVEVDPSNTTLKNRLATLRNRLGRSGE